MEHLKALASAIISLSSTIWMWISLVNAKDMAALIASVIAAIAGYFTIRYYYYATQEKKLNIKQLKNKK